MDHSLKLETYEMEETDIDAIKVVSNEDGTTSIHAWKKSGEMLILNKLPDSAKPSLIHSAVAQENLWMTTWLLLNGASGSCKNNLGLNCLHLAASLGNPFLVGLLAITVHVNEPASNLGATALHLVVGTTTYSDYYVYHPEFRPIFETKFIVTAYMLLKNGADPNKRCSFSFSPLHIVARVYDHLSNNIQLARLLVNYGAEIDAADECGFTPMYHALMAKNMAFAKFLIYLASNSNDEMHYYEHFLLEAFYTQNEETIDDLLELGADVQVKDEFGRNYVIKALKKLKNDDDCFQIVKLMLQKGVKSKKGNKTGVCSYRLKVVTKLAKEIGRMKKIKVCDKRDVTYFDIFFKRKAKLAACLRYQDVMDTLISGGYRKIFVHFADRIESNFMRGCARIEKFNHLYAILEDILHYVLPSELIITICQYFSDEDLKKIDIIT